jgi:hypothetical protein
MGDRYEAHVTIASSAEAIDGDFARAKALGARCDARWLHIVLDAGAHRSQPMLTARAGPTLREAHQRARRLATALASEGLEVVRVKIEGDLACDELAKDDDGRASSAAGRYFEHHTKVRLRDPRERSAAEAIAKRHDARASRNAFARDRDGEERFFTLRQRDVLSAVAVERARQFDEALSDAGLVVLTRQSEYVVFDSRIELDRGWSLAKGDAATTVTHRSETP